MAKKRSEIKEEYKWNLSLIYESEEEFLKEYQKYYNKIDEISNYKNNLMKDAENLYSYMALDEEISRNILKLYEYAKLNNDADTANTKYQSLYGKIKELMNKYSSISAFVNPELLQYEYQKIEEFIKKEPKLKRYEKDFKDLYRTKPHILSEKEEKILSILSTSFNNPEETYSYLTDSDMKFGTIINENNEEVELTESNYPLFLRSNKQNVREQAFKNLLNEYKKFKNSIASTLSGNVDITSKIAKVRNFSSSIEASLFDEDIDIKVYNTLIKTVKNNLKYLFDYFNYKKEKLNIKDFHIYDTYAKIEEDYNKKYTFDEAKELVINAVKPLGEEYVANIKKAFEERWIDIYPNEGKRGGAYSAGSYDTKPYVLLNYESSYDDVSTLAHELGHSMHSYLTRTNNEYPTGDYKIFVAEVASTVNELLLAKYMLKNSKDKKEKIFILNNLLDLYKATIYRQTMFAEFEQAIYEKHESKEVLTNELLSDMYYKLNKEYFGKDVIIDEEIKYEWMRIPHFFYDFYVYKYAIGLSCASKIVNDILTEKDNAREKYIKFLSSGSQKTPLELLKDAGCDLKDTKVVESAINMFNDLLIELKKLTN